jgi:hypothetical protein
MNDAKGTRAVRVRAMLLPLCCRERRAPISVWIGIIASNRIELRQGQPSEMRAPGHERHGYDLVGQVRGAGYRRCFHREPCRAEDQRRDQARASQAV